MGLPAFFLIIYHHTKKLLFKNFLIFHIIYMNLHLSVSLGIPKKNDFSLSN